MIKMGLLFPRRCPVCDEPLPIGENTCPECLKEFRYVFPPYCAKCGKAVEEDVVFCEDCKRIPHVFDKGRSLYRYASIAESLYRLKYEGRQEYGLFFGREMAKYLGAFIKECNPDGIVPIPLHAKRRKKRGFNQAERIANALGKELQIPVYPGYLQRVKDTKPLKLQNPEERQNNLKKAFIIGQNDVKLKRIVLVDDIYTTGSTMDEAARTLLENGTEHVYFVTLSGGDGA